MMVVHLLRGLKTRYLDLVDVGLNLNFECNINMTHRFESISIKTFDSIAIIDPTHLSYKIVFS